MYCVVAMLSQLNDRKLTLLVSVEVLCICERRRGRELGRTMTT